MSKRKRQQKKYKPPKIVYKVCPNCGKNKSVSGFGKHNDRGIMRANSWCIECHREHAQKKRNEPGYKERNAAYMREYRARVKAKSVIK